eukprot:7117130-Prymnesium_polylepis.2
MGSGSGSESAASPVRARESGRRRPRAARSVLLAYMYLAYVLTQLGPGPLVTAAGAQGANAGPGDERSGGRRGVPRGRP